MPVRRLTVQQAMLEIGRPGGRGPRDPLGGTFQLRISLDETNRSAIEVLKTLEQHITERASEERGWS
jgi:hypothetical protein